MSRSPVATNTASALPAIDTNPTQFANAAAEWRRALGREAVDIEQDALEQYASNETATARKVLAVIRPASAREVSELVRIAGKHRIPLYPVSRGHNWGYGAASPVTDDCVVVDLSRMNAIVAFDEDLGVVTVQPGVTPRQLRDYLDARGAPYLVPVHGAGPDCSLIGNALERGYGVTPYVDHFGAVTSLEAVLPDGSIYHPALSSLGGETADQVFKWGIGPYLDGLFSQGNFGIVTEMTVALAPIPETTEGFLFTLKRDADLEEAVMAVQDILKRIGNISGSINLMNDRRVLSMAEAYPMGSVPVGEVMPEALVNDLSRKNYVGPWTVGGILYGDKRLVSAAKALIGKRTKAVARRHLFFSRTRIDLLRRLLALVPDRLTRTLKQQIANVDEAFKVAEGAPSETALSLCYWKSGRRPASGRPMNPATDGCGIIWYSPLIPMKPDLVRRYVDTVKSICIKHRMEPLITLTSLSHRCFDSTVPLLFDREDPDETRRAKACYRALFETGRQQGFVPYRVGIDHMHLITQAGTTYWDLVSKIKRVIDPDSIIAPGRYCLR
ncbi:MAG: FAD-binding oxidoreductase [Candidatus Eisenbacteria bacterium]